MNFFWLLKPKHQALNKNTFTRCVLASYFLASSTLSFFIYDIGKIIVPTESVRIGHVQ